MYTFYCNVVTLKSENRVGDLVGIVISDDTTKKAISLEEAESLVKEKKIEGLKLEPYTISDAEDNVVGGGNILFFDDNNPILMGKIAWHKDLQENNSINFSNDILSAIDESPYR